MKICAAGKVMTFFRDHTEKFMKLLLIEKKTMEFCVSGKVMIFFLGGGGGGERLMFQVGEYHETSSSIQI